MNQELQNLKLAADSLIEKMKEPDFLYRDSFSKGLAEIKQEIRRLEK